MTSPALVQFTVPGVPVGKARAGKFGKRHYTPSKTREYEERVQRAASMAMAGMELMQGPLRMALFCYMPIPGSWSQKKQRAAANGQVVPTTKPDASNIAKSCEDACNKIVYMDDKQIAELKVVKRYSREPGVDVIVSVVDVS